MDETKKEIYYTSPEEKIDNQEVGPEIIEEETKVKAPSQREKVYSSSIAPAVKRITLPIEQVEAGRYSTTNRLVQLVYFTATVSSMLIFLRFIFKLLGAVNLGFVNIVYQLTDPLVSQFMGIFGQPVLYGSTGKFEIESLLAILAISILAFILAGLLHLLGGTKD